MTSRALCSHDDYLEALFWGCILHTSTLLVRRQAVEQVGLFDESLPMSDDYDMLLRIAESFPIINIPEPLSNYRLHDGSLSLRSFHQTIQCTDRVLESFCARNPPFRKHLRERKAAERTRVARMLLTRRRLLSLRMSAQAVRLRPTLKGAYVMLALSVLPIPYSALGKMKAKLASSVASMIPS